MLRLILGSIHLGERAPRYEARLEGTGELICISHQPEFDGARELIKRGHDPEELMVTCWAADGYDAIVPKPLRHFAQWTMEEGTRGMTVRKWEPHPDAVSRPGGASPMSKEGEEAPE